MHVAHFRSIDTRPGSQGWIYLPIPHEKGQMMSPVRPTHMEEESCQVSGSNLEHQLKADTHYEGVLCKTSNHSQVEAYHLDN